MITITSSNESLVQKDTTIDGSSSTSKHASRESNNLSPPPPLDTLSISTATLSSTTIATEDISSEFNCDCSSSVSSQDSNYLQLHAAATTTKHASPKRSVFSQYWKKTGETPMTLRSPRPDILSDTATHKPTPPTPPRSKRFPQSSSTSSHHTSEQLDRSLTNADLLEDDGESSSSSFPEEEESSSSVDLPPTPQASSPRRRSILPQVAPSFPHHRYSTSSIESLCRKSMSLSSVEEAYALGSLNDAHKSRSLPRMRSTSALLKPKASCLRRYQKYSPCKNSNGDDNSPTAIQHLKHSDLKRSDSSSTVSSVTFQEAVDIRHFEPPKFFHSKKGWSEYFK